MSRLLLHICCGGCAAYIYESLRANYEVIAFFYNPNIQPVSEYQWRKDEVLRLASERDWQLIVGNYDEQRWLEAVSGLENEPERGRRCQVCFAFRLREAFHEALKNGCTVVATTLSVSPHKDVHQINQTGEKLAGEFKIQFLAEDFKKNNGYLKSCQLARELRIKRQNYCGCIFSRR